MRRSNAELQDLKSQIVKRPSEIMGTNVPRGNLARGIKRLSAQLRLCGPNDAVKYSQEEFDRAFPTSNDRKGKMKDRLSYIRQRLKVVYNRAHVKFHVDNLSQRIYIWEDKV